MAYINPDSTSHTKKIMEYYNIFIKVLLKEVEKFNLNIDAYSTQVTQLTVELKEDFNGPYNRCAFLYRHATSYMHAFNISTKKFFAGYSNSKAIFSMWKSYSEVKVCSLSIGPGLDYLGFMLAVLEYDPIPPNFAGVKVVSNHGGWRNTANLLKEVLSHQGSAFEVLCSKYQNVGVIQADLIKSFLTSPKITAVSEANVILMLKTLNFLSSNPAEEESTAGMLFVSVIHTKLVYKILNFHSYFSKTFYSLTLEIVKTMQYFKINCLHFAGNLI